MILSKIGCSQIITRKATYSVITYIYISLFPAEQRKLIGANKVTKRAPINDRLEGICKQFFKKYDLYFKQKIDHSQSSLGACGAGPPCEACRRLRASRAWARFARKGPHFFVSVARFARKRI